MEPSEVSPPLGSEAPGGDIQVIARVVALLDHLDPDTPRLDTATSAELLGVGRSTAHRYLASMEKHGLLQRRTATSYELGPVLRRLGTMALSRLGVVEAAGPVMRELAAEVRSTVVLSVWGGRAPVVARVVPDTSRNTTISVEVGRSLPAVAAQSRLFGAYRGAGRSSRPTGSGRLRAVATSGDHEGEFLSVDDVLVARQSFDGGVKTLAAPVLTADGAIAATLAVIGLSLHLPSEGDQALAERLVSAGSRIVAT